MAQCRRMGAVPRPGATDGANLATTGTRRVGLAPANQQRRGPSCAPRERARPFIMVSEDLRILRRRRAARDPERRSRQADRLRHLARGRLGLACAALGTEDTGDGQSDRRTGLHGSSDRSASLRAKAAGLRRGTVEDEETAPLQLPDAGRGAGMISRASWESSATARPTTPTRPINVATTRSRSGTRPSCTSRRSCTPATTYRRPGRSLPRGRRAGPAAATCCARPSACSTAGRHMALSARAQPRRCAVQVTKRGGCAGHVHGSHSTPAARAVQPPPMVGRLGKQIHLVFEPT